MVLLRVMLIWPTNGHLYLYLSQKKLPSSIIAQSYQYTNLLSETSHVKLQPQHSFRYLVETMSKHHTAFEHGQICTLQYTSITAGKWAFTRKANQ